MHSLRNRQWNSHSPGGLSRRSPENTSQRLRGHLEHPADLGHRRQRHATQGCQKEEERGTRHAHRSGGSAGGVQKDLRQGDFSLPFPLLSFIDLCVYTSFLPLFSYPLHFI